ncbi:MAG: S41 family peptidase [Patescibacteria group bacterium]
MKTSSLWARRAFAVCALAAAFLFGYAVGGDRSGAVLGGEVDNIGDVYSTAGDVDFRLYWDVWRLLQQDYLRGPKDDKTLFYGSLEGLVDSLDDPHSAFFNPKRANDFETDISGKFEGIGAEIGKRDGQIVVIAPLADSPAEQAGLKAGDAVFLIDEKETDGMTVDEAVRNIRGAKGTTVVLTVLHEKAEQVEKISIVRNTIKIDSVKWEIGKDGIAKISLRYFNEDTAREFNRAVVGLLAKNPTGLIVDMRNNPGGLLDRAVTVAGEWTGPRNVVSERDKNGRISEFPASNVARLSKLKTVLLVNGGSASATEIVTGALQDYGLATVVGSKTYGKGSVQEYRELEDGSAIKITVAEWLTPKGRSIDDVGLEPDVVVEISDDDAKNGRDAQLERAIEIIKGK